ncbi:MAG: hypothetical protein AAF085_01825 [Planctomycetota bacterium]
MKGTIHWVSAAHALPVELRLYDRLFMTDDPNEGKDEDRDWRENLNLDSLVTTTAMAEPALAEAEPGAPLQFERVGYFTLDPDSNKAANKLVFNRTVTLKDSWAKHKTKK